MSIAKKYSATLSLALRHNYLSVLMPDRAHEAYSIIQAVENYEGKKPEDGIKLAQNLGIDDATFSALTIIDESVKDGFSAAVKHKWNLEISDSDIYQVANNLTREHLDDPYNLAKLATAEVIQKDTHYNDLQHEEITKISNAELNNSIFESNNPTIETEEVPTISAPQAEAVPDASSINMDDIEIIEEPLELYNTAEALKQIRLSLIHI